jgi:hypothetical protein
LESNELWFRVNERTEAIKSLGKTHEFLVIEQDDIYNWKWCIISLHNSVQSFMVLALQGSNSFQVLTDKSYKNYMKYYEEDGQYPELKLDYFLELFKKIKSDKMQLYVHSHSFIGNEQIDKNIELLNNYRNKFIHFVPAEWSIWIPNLIDIIKSSLIVIDFLVNTSGNIVLYNYLEREKLTQLISDIRKKVQVIEKRLALSC